MPSLANALFCFREQSLAYGHRIGAAGAPAMLVDMRGECDSVPLGLSEHGLKQRNHELHGSLVIIIKHEHGGFGANVLHEGLLKRNQDGKEQIKNTEPWLRQAMERRKRDRSSMVIADRHLARLSAFRSRRPSLARFTPA